MTKAEIPPSEIKYAGFWIRFLAGIVDKIFVFLLITFISFITGFLTTIFGKTFATQLESYLSIAIYTISFVYIVTHYLYFAFLLSSPWQATIGMKFVSIKIVDYDYRKISFARALGRSIYSILSGIILFLGYFMIAFTKRKQGLHDLMASTYVIKD